jgi:CBS domain-containing protein
VSIDQRAALLKSLSDFWAGKPSSDPLPLTATQTASEIMTSPVIHVSESTSAREALRLLMHHHIKRLPVLDENDQVIGLVGRAGLMRVLLAIPTDSG